MQVEIVLLRKVMEPALVAYSNRMPHMGLAVVMAHGLLKADDLQICQYNMSNFPHSH